MQLRLDSQRLLRWAPDFCLSYTWSHSIDNSSVSGLSGFLGGTPGNFLDAFQTSLDRGPSDFDVRHRFSAHWVWQLPFTLAPRNAAKRYLLGGWEISGILNYQTGQPFTLMDSGVPDNSNGVITRPRLTGPLPRSVSLVSDAASPNTYLYLPVDEVYDAAGRCIAAAAPFACEISVNGPFNGTLGRNSFRQPGLYFVNTALIKNVPLRNEINLQLRAEFYNPFNHPNLYIIPGTNDVYTSSFNPTAAQTTPGVTAAFKDNRQIVAAVKIIF